MNKFGIDYTNGVIIGDVAAGHRYEFWQNGRMLMRDHFLSDAEAISAWKERFPEQSCEMRVFDQGRDKKDAE